MTPELRDYTWTTGQVAERLGVDESTVWRMTKRGWLDYVVTPGGHRRYRPSDVDRVAVRLERGERIDPGEG
jgi:excisionase family DNA binding protein